MESGNSYLTFLLLSLFYDEIYASGTVMSMCLSLLVTLKPSGGFSCHQGYSTFPCFSFLPGVITMCKFLKFYVVKYLQMCNFCSGKFLLNVNKQTNKQTNKHGECTKSEV